ncbi:MAG: SHOCT domain-containing protein [Clostridiales bacterium]|nr:SHOCT domain-containing protein [Clostridiales bacterium]
MSKRITVRPGKFQSTIGFIMGCIFCVVGIYILTRDFGFTGIIWTLFAILITVSCGMNAFHKNNVNLQSYEVEGELADTDLSNFYTESEVEERLIRLKDLYDHKLITEFEYTTKKAEVLKHL